MYTLFGCQNLNNDCLILYTSEKDFKEQLPNKSLNQYIAG